MTRDQIVSLIRDRLAFHLSLDVNIIYRHMDLMQSNFEFGNDRLPIPWFIFDTTETVSTVAAQRTVDVPNDFIAFDDNWPLIIVNADGVDKPLTKKTAAELAPMLDQSGFPKYYAFDGERLHLYPKPDAVYTIRLYHYSASTAFSASATNKWFDEFPNLIIEEAVFSLARSIRDEGALKLVDVKGQRDKYLVRCEAQQHALMSYVVGGED